MVLESKCNPLKPFFFSNDKFYRLTYLGNLVFNNGIHEQTSNVKKQGLQQII